MATFFKPGVKGEHFTNINNTNYINNTNDTNDINTTLCITKARSDNQTPAGASGLSASSSGVSRRGLCVSPEEVLPIQWKGVKIDIFNNAAKGTKLNLKVKLGIIKHDTTTQSLIAALNSPIDYIWRKVDTAAQTTAHWQVVRTLIDEFKQDQIDFRVSKCSLPSKGGSTEVVVFLTETDKEWIVIVVREAEQFHYRLPKDCVLTSSQKTGNIISSKFIGNQITSLITCKELGI